MATGAWMPELSSFNWFGHKNEQLSQFTPRFQRDQMCFGIFDISDIEIKLFTVSIMPKPVYLMTVQEAHKEYNSLTDKIRAKYEQLDSGEFGSPGTPAFDAEACELAHLLAHVSKLCQKLNLPPPKELYRPTVFKH